MKKATQLVVVLFVLGLVVAGTLAYDCAKPCYNNLMCCSIPSDNEYYLTSFCGARTACGDTAPCNYAGYFSADSQRFGCGSILNVCRGKDCIRVRVIDAGPALWVEKDADKAILDASPSTCKRLFGSTSCGWSDRRLITVHKTLEKYSNSTVLGPFVATDEQLEAMRKEHEIAMQLP
jgi:hypothetical protein